MWLAGLLIEPWSWEVAIRPNNTSYNVVAVLWRSAQHHSSKAKLAEQFVHLWMVGLSALFVRTKMPIVIRNDESNKVLLSSVRFEEAFQVLYNLFYISSSSSSRILVAMIVISWPIEQNFQWWAAVGWSRPTELFLKSPHFLFILLFHFSLPTLSRNGWPQQKTKRRHQDSMALLSVCVLLVHVN